MFEYCYVKLEIKREKYTSFTETQPGYYVAIQIEHNSLPSSHTDMTLCQVWKCVGTNK